MAITPDNSLFIGGAGTVASLETTSLLPGSNLFIILTAAIGVNSKKFV
jgi:hypothetical protein